MRFYSKLVFICNICFIVTVILRYIETGLARGNKEALIKLPFLQNIVVLLGYGAIFLNFIFLLLVLYLLLTKRIRIIPGWIVIFNLLILAWQVAFHFNLY